MITLQEAMAIIQENRLTGGKELVPLSDALDRVIAEDLAAPEPSPRFTNSAMDGFAVIWKDVESVVSGQSVVLSIVGESRAGVPFDGKLDKGKAIKISTGAMVPSEANTVIPIEDVDVLDNSIRVREVKKMNQHVRFRGEEFEDGEIVLRKGRWITPAHIGLLASLGVNSVPVYKKPRISILVTGTELVSVDDKIKPWQIRDSNGQMLLAATNSSGAQSVSIEKAGDRLEDIKVKIDDMSARSDIILISGGVSGGPHDLVKQAAWESGFETLFWKVRQKPGKPLFVAKKSKILLYGLPGNPVSALTCYLNYVHPIIQNMLGMEFLWESIDGVLAKQITNSSDRIRFLNICFEITGNGKPCIHVLEKQNSHMLTTIVQADGFILLDPGGTLKKGEMVDVYQYPWK